MSDTQSHQPRHRSRWKIFGAATLSTVLIQLIIACVVVIALFIIVIVMSVTQVKSSYSSGNIYRATQSCMDEAVALLDANDKPTTLYSTVTQKPVELELRPIDRVYPDKVAQDIANNAPFYGHVPIEELYADTAKVTLGDPHDQATHAEHEYVFMCTVNMRAAAETTAPLDTLHDIAVDIR